MCIISGVFDGSNPGTAGSTPQNVQIFFINEGNAGKGERKRKYKIKIGGTYICTEPTFANHVKIVVVEFFCRRFEIFEGSSDFFRGFLKEHPEGSTAYAVIWFQMHLLKMPTAFSRSRCEIIDFISTSDFHSVSLSRLQQQIMLGIYEIINAIVCLETVL